MTGASVTNLFFILQLYNSSLFIPQKAPTRRDSSLLSLSPLSPLNPGTRVKGKERKRQTNNSAEYLEQTTFPPP